MNLSDIGTSKNGVAVKPWIQNVIKCIHVDTASHGKLNHVCVEDDLHHDNVANRHYVPNFGSSSNAGHICVFKTPQKISFQVCCHMLLQSSAHFHV